MFRRVGSSETAGENRAMCQTISSDVRNLVCNLCANEDYSLTYPVWTKLAFWGLALVVFLATFCL
jgi:hypothetical protein